jgi:antitoxin component HigA of HigAB toxin-antitoxin module
MANTENSLQKMSLYRLTYAALGARLGISPDAARMLARRRDWHRVIANRRPD